MSPATQSLELAAGAAAPQREKTPVSVLIPTRNEERNIAKCLASLAWADEVVVIDSHSADRTAEIAREHGATVVSFAWDGRGPRKRNWALEHVPWKHDWVLLLDADEEVTPELAREMDGTVRGNSEAAGYLVRYHYYFLGRLLRHGDPLWKLSLVRHRKARFETIDVPEVTRYDVELHEWVRADGPIKRLRSVIVHRDFEDLHHHFDRHNTYSDWEALLRTRYRKRDARGEVRPRLAGSAVERRRFFKRWFLAMPGKPLLYFAYSYILRGGFLDGRAGVIYNTLKSAYWYQVSAKEYELKLRERRPRRRRAGGDARASDQVAFYRESVDAEEEITRPRCYPRSVQFLLRHKIEDAWSLAGLKLGTNGRGSGGDAKSAPERKQSVLIVCCGSGMEAEMVARAGFRVTALDFSPDAVERARERARRYSFPMEAVVGDAERLPFGDNSFDYAMVHDGLHHLQDAYAGVRELLRVARRAVVIAEPADAALTHLFVRLGLSGEYEEAGNFVYRIDPRKLAEVFRAAGVKHWHLRRSFIYYQPWTFPIYRAIERARLFWILRAAFAAGNFLLGPLGNSLRAIAWKETAANGDSRP